MQYRQDIQIMRGVAVLLVVLFHLNTPGLSGGFLGVDVFFVISGFLMALLYQPGMATEFYRRRAVRLLPAYFFVVMATVLASAWLTLPADHSQVVEQGLYASVFSSNIGFWNQNSYFSKAEFNPLLHLWSLGVEIQFYLLVPLLAWLHTRFRLALPALFVASLLGCLALVMVSPKTAFFLMPFRIWQFLLGAAVAQYLTVKGAVRSPRPIWGFVALVVVITLVTLFPVDGQLTNLLLGHPGGAAVLTTVATGVILACGLPQGFQNGIFGNVLQRLGNWSYSIYLVHFPIIVLCLYQPFSGTLLAPTSGAQALLIVALIALFTVVSYGIFERQAGWIRRAGRGTAIGSIATVIALSLASAPVNQWQYSEKERNVSIAFKDRDVFRCGQLLRIFQQPILMRNLENPALLSCELTKNLPKSAPVFLLVGDSHADSAKSAFTMIAQKRGYRLFFISSNYVLIPAPDGRQILALAKSLNASGIVLHYSSSNVNKAYASGFTNMAAEHGLPVAWLLPVPTYSEPVPKLIWNNFSKGVGFHPSPANSEETEIFKKKLMLEGVKTFDSYPAFCAEKCDVADAAMRPFYFDGGHLTLTGAERLRPVIEQLMTWLISHSQGHAQSKSSDNPVRDQTFNRAASALVSLGGNSPDKPQVSKISYSPLG